MKKFLTILACYTAIVAISSLAGTLLALYVLSRFPWMVTASMMVLIIGVVVSIDYRRNN